MDRVCKSKNVGNYNKIFLLVVAFAQNSSFNPIIITGSMAQVASSVVRRVKMYCELKVYPCFQIIKYILVKKEKVEKMEKEISKILCLQNVSKTSK